MQALCRNLCWCICGLLVLGSLVVFLGFYAGKPVPLSNPVPDPVYLMNYDTSTLPPTESNLEIRLGYEVFMNTSVFLGPEQPDPDRLFSGNRLACANCHLNAGTKPFGAPLIGVVKRFPQYRGREDKIGTIEERVNGCMERSMNGRKMPEEMPEMRALIAYLSWLGRYAPKDGKVLGQGFLPLEIPERAVDLVHGEAVFQTHCTVCHGSDGQGQASPAGGYAYPPLWGDDSFNNGAGMTRVITAAQFIKGNMPFGVTWDRPLLTDEEAYDVAGYINSRLRPDKPNRELDFPDLSKKPVSTPYGPFADPFPPIQHQMGPFQPIMDYYKKEFNIIKSK
ncbi:c-type cytochrome [Robiginitalea sp. SC105]|nr:c-type cytochrome [Robiginitalea sp. SC105]